MRVHRCGDIIDQVLVFTWTRFGMVCFAVAHITICGVLFHCMVVVNDLLLRGLCFPITFGVLLVCYRAFISHHSVFGPGSVHFIRHLPRVELFRTLWFTRYHRLSSSGLLNCVGFVGGSVVTPRNSLGRLIPFIQPFSGGAVSFSLTLIGLRPSGSFDLLSAVFNGLSRIPSGYWWGNQDGRGFRDPLVWECSWLYSIGRILVSSFWGDHLQGIGYQRSVMVDPVMLVHSQGQRGGGHGFPSV